MKEQVFVSLVLHARDAHGKVASFLRRIDVFLEERFEHYEIVVVDNASRDGTLEEARAAAEGLRGSVAVLSLSRRLGIEAAMLAGTDRAIGDYVFEVETSQPDYPLTVLDELFRAVRGGYDIAAAIPASHQPLPTRLFYGLFNRASGMDVPLTTERASVVSRRALNAVLGIDDKHRYRKALYGLTGYRKKLVSYVPEGGGGDPRSFGEKAGQAVSLFISFTDVGSRLSIILSLAFLFFSFAAGLFTLYSYYSVTDISRGWSSLMCFLSLSFSGVFLVLALLGEYVRHMLREVQNRPAYILRAQYAKPALRAPDQPAA